ncbi:hypothetical protein [Stenotrophomonas sp.]|uniref:hypothetical protein n=1 Tax=Stenotrophomonas sp. TaxID=69392 RepID=UPI002FC59710
MNRAARPARPTLPRLLPLALQPALLAAPLSALAQDGEAARTLDTVQVTASVRNPW